LAHEQLLYGPDGEFLLDAFEEDGEELTPAFAVRQAERALKKDQQSALYHYELGLAHRRLGRHELARASFAASAALDPPNPWPWFDLGRSERQLGQMRQAAAAFECAAEASSGGERGRFLVWSARSMFEAGDRATAEKLLEEARLSSPGLGDELARAASAAASAAAGAEGAAGGGLGGAPGRLCARGGACLLLAWGGRSRPRSPRFRSRGRAGPAGPRGCGGAGGAGGARVADAAEVAGLAGTAGATPGASSAQYERPPDGATGGQGEVEAARERQAGGGQAASPGEEAAAALRAARW
jgi:tetratricopeptide (TPR) repeat protein